MAFNKKTWKDRVSEQPQRRLLTPTDGGEAMTVDVTRQEGIVIQEGDAFSAANMNDLETRIKNTFDSDESTLNAVNTKANTNANNIASLQTNLTSVSNRVTTNTNNINANKTTETNHYNSLATRATNLETRATNVEKRATTLEGELTANSKRIYMDYKNGKYGINTSANRGADTFIPFNNVNITQTIECGTNFIKYGHPNHDQSYPNVGRTDIYVMSYDGKIKWTSYRGEWTGDDEPVSIGHTITNVTKGTSVSALNTNLAFSSGDTIRINCTADRSGGEPGAGHISFTGTVVWST